jgi:hypothetical protein
LALLDYSQVTDLTLASGNERTGKSCHRGAFGIGGRFRLPRTVDSSFRDHFQRSLFHGVYQLRVRAH